MEHDEGGGKGGGVTDTFVFDSSGGHHPRGKKSINGHSRQQTSTG